ncbi:MAG: HIT family protein [Candidatus Doudnabacteria bacterium]|nr:HIT family protein [Candidatus Doudnabacteria bacterium]
MKECIFCKLIAGELPSFRVYEDQDFVAFLDIHPVATGHTLVVPKAHSHDIEDTAEEVFVELMKRVKKIGQAMAKALGVPGYNVGINNGRSAGQLVDHIHAHIIPRKGEGDGLLPWPGREKVAEEELAEIAERIRKQILRT